MAATAFAIAFLSLSALLVRRLRRFQGNLTTALVAVAAVASYGGMLANRTMNVESAITSLLLLDAVLAVVAIQGVVSLLAWFDTPLPEEGSDGGVGPTHPGPEPLPTPGSGAAWPAFDQVRAAWERSSENPVRAPAETSRSVPGRLPAGSR